MKITKKGKVTIYDNSYILKEEKDLSNLYNYLDSREFKNYVKLESYSNNKSKYKYINDYSLDNNQKCMDIINSVALLHNKTSYTKNISYESYKNIYDNIIGYINYLSEYYNKLLIEYESIEYPYEHQIIFLCNYSKLLELITFLKSELNEWLHLVENKTKQRVSLVHGNLSIEHALRSDTLYIISWDKYRIDSPILDIINFYHKVWYKCEFSNVLDIYLDKCKLSDEELKLLLINLCIPVQINISNDEFYNINEMNKLFNYIYKTEDLIRPYYSKKNEE